MTVTIKHVAKKANVSISTVSRVINDSKPVNDDIKRRVFEVIDELGYTPNPVARSLVMKKSKLIGVIVPDIASSFIGEVLNAVEDIAKTYGYDIILCNTYGELKQELRYFQLLKAKQVEGIIFTTRMLMDAHRELFKDFDLPLVMINRDGSDLGILSVAINHERAAFDMTSYLIHLGHKNIVLIRNGVDAESFGTDQMNGYERAHRENGMTFSKDKVYEGYFSMEEAYKLVDNMLKDGNKPDAIVTTSDEMAVGAINAAVDNGLQVPRDLSVSGAYDSKMSRYYRPKLTTVKYPVYDIGAIAVRLIIKKINGQEPKEKLIQMPYELVIRDSTRKI